MKIETVSAEGEFRESLKETDWAWLAGFIDGEGHLGIRRGYAANKNKNRKEWGQDGWVWYSSRISISNTDQKSMRKSAHMMHGTLAIRLMKESNLVPIYIVEIGARRKVLRILQHIMPYLIVKKDIANLMLEFVNLSRGSGVQKQKLCEDAVTLSQARRDKRLLEGATVMAERKR